jgi:membrane-associated phospholipid phosphatase
MTQFIQSWLKYIGNYGPFILFVSSVFFIWNSRKSSMLNYYVFGIFLSGVINVVLKLLIRQPRPSDDKQKFDLTLRSDRRMFIFDNGVPYDVFGMPSGHAQSIGFSLVFVFLTIPNNSFRMFCIAISLITLWQRVHYNHHTVLQVFIGTVVGGLFAYFIFCLSRKNIAGVIKEKFDDNASL